MNNCMYGKPHPGVAFVVRNKVGKTISGLCSHHHKENYNDLLKRGFYCHSMEEMEARGEEEFTDDSREQAVEDVAQESGPTWEHDNLDDSGPGAEELGPARLQSLSAGTIRNAHDDHPSGRVEETRAVVARPDNRLTETALEERQLESGPAERRIATRGTQALRTVDVPALAWWQGAGELELTIEQAMLLREPFPATIIEQNYQKEWYVPWVHIWQRLLDVFAPDRPALVPLCEPMIEKDHVLVHYCMLVRGQFAGEAWGYCERKGNNTKMDIGNAIESATSEAIRRIGKRNGVGLALWEKETIRELEGRRK